MIRVLTLTLALLIAVTSQQMAMARGMTYDAAGQVILCTGQGVITVTLDADGNPMGPVHFCPDCVMTAMAVADGTLAETVVVIHMQILAQTPVRVVQSVISPIWPQPRGPPVSV